MTKIYKGKEFIKFIDQNSGSIYNDIIFDNCNFSNCAVSLASMCKLHTRIENITIKNCSVFSCDVGTAICEEVQVDGLKTSDDLLFFWGTLFKHVVFKGRIGNIKINSSISAKSEKGIQCHFDGYRQKFYKNIDWAIDISKAKCLDCEIEGIPASLIRRDSASQLVVKRSNAQKEKYRKYILENRDDIWIFIIEQFLASGEDDIVLVAPKAKQKKKYEKLLESLLRLREIGLAEPD